MLSGTCVHCAKLQIIIALAVGSTDKYGIFKERSAHVKELYWQIICVVISKIWKTRCAGVLGQKTTSETVKQTKRDLKRKRTAVIRGEKTTPRHIVMLL